MSVGASVSIIRAELEQTNAKLVAISKTQSIEDMMEAYHAGQRIFGENIVQELVKKKGYLPEDIEWHLVGHLQRNKVKYIAPFITLIHSVDSLALLQEIDKEAAKNHRKINCLLQLYIADETSKFGLDFDEVIELLRTPEYLELKNTCIVGLMGIASNTKNLKQIQAEFHELSIFFKGLKESFFKNIDTFKELSIGMSKDYKVAIKQGSSMVRLGSIIFRERTTEHRHVEE